MKSNELFICSIFDNVNPATSHISFDSLYWSIQQQAMIISMKEIYGWLCIAGIFCILAFTLRESSLRPHMVIPKLSNSRRAVKHELKMDKILGED